MAGLIGAVANNGQGGTGVAYGAKIVPIKFLATSPFEPQPDEQSYIDAFSGNGAPIDIFNHSWGCRPGESARAIGPTPAMSERIDFVRYRLVATAWVRFTYSPLETTRARLSRRIRGFGNLASMGTNGFASSRYVISVGMIDHDLRFRRYLTVAIFNDDGSITAYGEAGTALLVVAPPPRGRSTSATIRIPTAESSRPISQMAASIFLPCPAAVSQDVDQFPNTDYTSRFGGTSAAAPLVSGVIALMLEADKLANGGVSTLSYRDVQEILVRSAKQVSPDDGSWIVNSTPFFSDPIRHDPGPPNYETGGNYPDDEDLWNDEIIYQIVPGKITTPAVQAKTAVLTSVSGATFTVEAVPGGPHDGEAGNDIMVKFVHAAGPNGALATFSMATKTITISVSGTPNWSDIKIAVDAINGGEDFVMKLTANENTPFSPADAGALMGTLTGGVAEEGEEPKVERASDYVGYNPVLSPLSLFAAAPLATNGAGYTVSQGWVADLATSMALDTA